MSPENAVINRPVSTLATLSLRPRRLHRLPALRRMVRETQLSVNGLIYPLFFTE